MSLAIEIPPHVAQRLQRFHERAPEIVRDELHLVVLESQLLLEREIKENTPVGVGGGASGLKGSFHSLEPRDVEDGVIGITGTSALHAVPVESGARPHFPPIRPLQDWAEYKLDLPPAAARQAAFAIARKIAVRGTEGQHMVERARDDNAGQVARIFEAGIERMSRRIGEA